MTFSAKRLMLALLAIAATCCASLSAVAADRVALVIGNSKYVSVTPLPNPVNDATDLAKVLRDIGFDVTVALDTSQAQMEQALHAFSLKLEDASVGLFFYSGHGIQVSGQNALIPVDARLVQASSIPLETVDLQVILDLMMATRPQAKRNVSLVLLDAGRNNPFTVPFNHDTRSVARGLAAVEPPSSAEALIAFSTAPNATTLDGSGRNSPFTAALIAQIQTPGLDISLVMRNVRRDVAAATGGYQTPWYHSSLSDDVILVPAR